MLEGKAVATFLLKPHNVVGLIVLRSADHPGLPCRFPHHFRHDAVVRFQAVLEAASNSHEGRGSHIFVRRINLHQDVIDAHLILAAAGERDQLQPRRGPCDHRVQDGNPRRFHFLFNPCVAIHARDGELDDAFPEPLGQASDAAYRSRGITISLAILVFAFHAPGLSTWVVLGSIISYTAFFAIGMGPVPWVVISEIFPNKIRGRAASVATSALWTGTLLVTFTFLSLIRDLGVSGTFSIYAELSAFSFVFIWSMVPEKRGKTLEEIQQQWEN